MDALVKSVVYRIKTILTLTDANVGDSYDGQPPAFSGEEYWQVHEGASDNSGVNFLDERFNVDITLTRKTGYTPQDRIGQDTLGDLTTGIRKRARTIAIALNMDYTTLDVCGGTKGQVATEFWAGGQAWSLTHSDTGFREPLRYGRIDKPEVKGPEWFWATDHSDHSNGPPTGIAITIHLTGARRTQDLIGAT